MVFIDRTLVRSTRTGTLVLVRTAGQLFSKQDLRSRTLFTS